VHRAQQTFVLGANLPWVHYGDFGANAWHPAGGFAGSDVAWLGDRLRQARQSGITALRWFLFCDGRAGIRFDGNGRPIGLDDRVAGDVETALALTSAAGMHLVPVLFDYLWCGRRRTVRGVQLGGRARLLAQAATRTELLDRVVTPVLQRFGTEPGILAWDVFNEPEWITYGVGTWRPWRSLSRLAMRDWLSALVGRVHAHTRHLATVGSASARWLDLVRGVGLDVYQPHWYDHLDRRAPLTTPIARLRLDRPAWLGEFPTRPITRTAGEICEAAHRAGYAGAFAWSLLADDPVSRFNDAAPGLSAWASTHTGRSGSGSPHEFPGTVHAERATERQEPAS
jgi:hypothetical protein